MRERQGGNACFPSIGINWFSSRSPSSHAGPLVVCVIHEREHLVHHVLTVFIWRGVPDSAPLCYHLSPPLYSQVASRGHEHAPNTSTLNPKPFEARRGVVLSYITWASDCIFKYIHTYTGGGRLHRKGGGHSGRLQRKACWLPPTYVDFFLDRFGRWQLVISPARGGYTTYNGRRSFRMSIPTSVPPSKVSVLVLYLSLGSLAWVAQDTTRRDNPSVNRAARGLGTRIGLILANNRRGSSYEKLC